MGSSLATQTKEAYQKASTALCEAERSLIKRARASSNAPATERDELLRIVVESYRGGRREAWAAVLLDLLTPGMLERLKLYRAEEPGIDVEDIRQQFVMELLAVAISVPLPTHALFVERRLLLRAGQGVRRWLRKERLRQAGSQSLEARLEKEDHE